MLDEVSAAEQDELLGMFGHGTLTSREAVTWWLQQTGKAMGKLDKMDEYEELKNKFLASLPLGERLAGLSTQEVLSAFEPKERLAGLQPEQVLAAFNPQERLAGLQPEQVLSAFKPEERLAGLQPEQVLSAFKPEERLAGLPAEEVGAALGAEAVLVMPNEALAALSPDYLATLPTRVRKAVAARLAPKKATKAQPSASKRKGR